MQLSSKIRHRHSQAYKNLPAFGLFRMLVAIAVVYCVTILGDQQAFAVVIGGSGGSSGGVSSDPEPRDTSTDKDGDSTPGSKEVEFPLFQTDPSRIRIEFRPGVTSAAAELVARKYGLAPLDSFTAPDTNALVMLTSKNPALQNSVVHKTLSALSKDPQVKSVQSDTTFLPQDSGTNAQTYSYMNTQYVFRLIGLGLAQNISTGDGADIALIDTWVDQRHPAFAHAALSSVDSSGPKSGNGRESSISTGEAAASVFKDHGTRMAGILAANGSIRGVAPNANVLLYDVFAPGEDQTGAASGFYIAKTLSDAVTRHVDVVNLSLCGPYDGLVSRVITNAVHKQVAIVAAAGNNGPLARACYPAANDGVIAVTATDHADRIYEKANQGQYIALAAPGVDILTAASQGKLGMATGTSFAAAHVSGVVALLRSRHPDLSVDSIKKILSYSAKDIGPKGLDTAYGAGRLSALEAMILSDQNLADYEAFSAH